MSNNNFLKALAPLFILLGIVITLPSCLCSDVILLQPSVGRLIYEMGEPSGISYCSSTNSLWTISDSDAYIFESDFEGNLLQKWRLPSDVHKDVEAVSCDDQNQLIYIMEEGRMRLSSFILPNKNNEDSFHLKNSRYELILNSQMDITYTVSTIEIE